MIQPINFGWQYADHFQEEYVSPEFDASGFETVDIPQL